MVVRLKMFHDPERNLIVMLRPTTEEWKAVSSSAIIGSSTGAVISRVGAISASFIDEQQGMDNSDASSVSQKF